MKQLQGRLWAKLLAGFLLIVSVLALCASGLACIVLSKSNAYTDGGAELMADFFPSASQSFERDMDDARRYYENYRSHQLNPGGYDPQWEEAYLSRFSPENTNFYFAVYDEKGELVFSGGEGEVKKGGKTDYAASRYLCQQTSGFEVRTNEQVVEKRVVFYSSGQLWNYVNEQYARDDTYGFRYEIVEDSDTRIVASVYYVEFESALYTLAGYARETLTAHDGIWREYRFLSWMAAHRVFLLVLSVLLAVCALALFFFLLCAAGHAAGHDGIRLNWFDRIPLDLLTLVWVLLLALGIVLADTLFSSYSYDGWWGLFALLVSALAVCACIWLLSYLMTFAARCKAGTWYQNTLLYRLWLLVARAARWLWGGARYALRSLPFYWKAALIWAGLCIAEFIVGVLTQRSGSWVFFWLAEKVLLTFALFVAITNLNELKKGGERLAAGDLSSKIDTSHMFWDFRQHAENLNAIGGGMQKAVEQKTRSERLKTELITNVSHDIKTPLTSIVNYVDLLKKEHIEPEAAREYLEVLDRQSARLKKLTEDLVEASKASTGNLSCTLEPTDVNVLLGQVMGEYEGRLEAGQLEPVVQTDPSDPKILADGRLLWRVFDNLLSNICKYALPGTRVYLSSTVSGGKVTICFKNISRYPLNITADELMERFVRGDSSRSTEGSGLGLSIAQSLSNLQHGDFVLCVDGDLFKASVTFDVAD